MKKIAETCYRFLEGCIKYIAILPLLLIFILTLLYQNHITFDILETSTITPNGLKFFLLLPVGLVLFYGIWQLLKWIPDWVLFLVLTLAYLVGGIYLITHIQMNLRYDSGICYWNALNFVQGDFTNLDFGEYFYINPHQLGLVSYNCLMVLISDDPNLVYYVNLLWILLGNFFLWRSAALLYPENPRIPKLVILLSFGFLPQFFYLFYAYGQVPGLGCLLIALYLTIRTIKKDSKWTFFLSLLFIAAACLLRQNFLIGGIALILIYLLYALKKQKWWYILGALAIGCCLFFPSPLLNNYYENVADTDLSHGAPMLLYVAMGLQECEEPWRANGWYNGFNHTIYEACSYDGAAATQLAMDSIKESFHQFTYEPEYALEFFSEKIITTWCEPTYQSIWSGPLISMNCPTEVPLLENLYSGGSAFELLASLMNVLVVFLLFFSLIQVVRKVFIHRSPLDSLELFCLLFFIGGFLFHLFWETKSQYVYPYVALLVPTAANGMAWTFAFLEGKIRKLFQRLTLSR